jgi:hypothetical protein
MVSITASTTHAIKKKAPAPSKTGSAMTSVGTSAGTSAGSTPSKPAARRGATAPPLKPLTLATAAAIAELFRHVLGESSTVLHFITAAPHAASTTRDRGAAAADLAVACNTLGAAFVLKECGIVASMQRILFPDGIQALFRHSTDAKEFTSSSSGLKPSMSAVSLTSLIGADDNMTYSTTANNSQGTDSKRGKTTPAVTREGCLLLIRALCELVGARTIVEPFMVGAFLAACLDECGSASGDVRQAAEDASAALVQLAHPWAFVALICPLLLQSLNHSDEWRCKTAALERLAQCCATAPTQVQKLIPTLIPAITNQVWDTKPQVSKAARNALLAICQCNANKDIVPAIPAVVNAICKPADTNKAVSELMSTTFVVPVDASTLAILCPVLARALKEKLAVHKRAACLVISNMAKLVVSPAAVAPFGNLLLPELQKVATHVQFQEIRDEALRALATLTRALGELYNAANEQQDDEAKNTTTKQAADLVLAEKMAAEQARVEAEQRKIEQERELAKQRDEAVRALEQDEKRRFKEAMDAQRRLDQLAQQDSAALWSAEEKKREALKLSTKSEAGNCQSCGLKKCKKTCLFYTAAVAGDSK